MNNPLTLKLSIMNGKFRVIKTNGNRLTITNEHSTIVFDMNNVYYKPIKELIEFDSKHITLRSGLKILLIDIDKMDEDKLNKLIAYIDYADHVFESGLV
jgi:hypothetical protein